MKHFISVWSLLITAAAVACSSPPEPVAKDSPPVPVSLGRAEHIDMTTGFEAGGVLRARSTAVIASRVMAPVAAVHVRPGDRVQRSARLITLDDREIAANSARAVAALTAADEAARAAEADTRAAESGVVLARATHGRISALYDKRSATPQELDQALAGLTGAEAQLASAKARAAAAIATRDAARAAARAADINTSYALLSAPFDGIVVERAVDPGSLATPGAPLLTVEDPSRFRLETQLDEARAAFVAPGQTADVRLDNQRSDWTTGQVVEIARVDPTSHSFLVKIEVASTPALRSGLFGRARFAGPTRRTLTVPAAAILRRGQLTFVFAVADGLARLRPVTVGAAANERVEVFAGIQDGQSVVVNPPASLADGTHVSGQVALADPAARQSGETR